MGKHTFEISRQVTIDRLKTLGFAPRTIFDVGFASGTSGLYGVFENVRYCIIEPLQESRTLMSNLASQYPGAVAVEAAAGARIGELELGIDPGFSGSSFFLKSRETRLVPIVTLDSLVAKHGFEGPMLVKLDVQGYEFEVLRGAVETLKQTEIVITEQTLWSDRKSSQLPTPFQTIEFFEEHGFTLYDIAGMLFQPRDGALAEMDFVFCKKDSELRKHASYRTPEQAAARQAEKMAVFHARTSIRTK